MPILEMNVGGMTCAHCERAVREAIVAQDPAAVVRLDLPAGRLRVETHLTAESIAAAIRSAGYTT